MKYDLLKIMDDLSIEYRYLEHEPITGLESALLVKEKYNLQGKESKNIVLRSKAGNYYVMVSEVGVKFDRGFMKELVGEKLSFATPGELEAKTGYVVGCATSFGYDEDVTIIVDEHLFESELLNCSTGVPTSSYVMHTADLRKVYESIPNKVIYSNLGY